MKSSSDDRVSGIAIGATAILWVVLAMFRPQMVFTRSEAVGAYVEHALALRVVFGGLLVLTGIAVTGFTGFATRLGWQSTRVRMGLVAYVGGAALVCAALLLRGFVLPDLALKYQGAGPDDVTNFRTLANLAYSMSDVLGRMGVAGFSAAIVLWSWALLSRPKEAWTLGLAGEVVALAPVLGFATGFVHLDSAGMGGIIAAQAAWSVGVAWLMLRGSLVPAAA